MLKRCKINLKKVRTPQYDVIAIEYYLIVACDFIERRLVSPCFIDIY